MAFIVEDGSGLTDSTSFMSLAEFSTWAEERGYDLTPFSDEEQQGALLAGTAYLDALSWRGVLQSLTQALALPRTSLYDDEGRYFPGLPARVVDATGELAWQHLDGNLINEIEEKGTKSEKVGDIQVEYFEGLRKAPQYPFISRLVGNLLYRTSGVSKRILRV